MRIYQRIRFFDSLCSGKLELQGSIHPWPWLSSSNVDHRAPGSSNSQPVVPTISDVTMATSAGRYTRCYPSFVSAGGVQAYGGVCLAEAVPVPALSAAQLRCCTCCVHSWWWWCPPGHSDGYCREIAVIIYIYIYIGVLMRVQLLVSTFSSLVLSKWLLTVIGWGYLIYQLLTTASI